MDFLSEKSIEMHRGYLDSQKLKLSVFEASYPSIVGQDHREIARSSLPIAEKRQILDLISEIKAHEIFFDSFVKSGVECEKNREISGKFGSEAKFLYDLLRYAADKSGFLALYLNRNGRVCAYVGTDYQRLVLGYDVRLAIDLFEHAYFLDYGFDKEKYLSKALSRLNLSALTPKNMLQNRYENGKIKKKT